MPIRTTAMNSVLDDIIWSFWNLLLLAPLDCSATVDCIILCFQPLLRVYKSWDCLFLCDFFYFFTCEMDFTCSKQMIDLFSPWRFNPPESLSTLDDRDELQFRQLETSPFSHLWWNLLILVFLLSSCSQLSRLRAFEPKNTTAISLSPLFVFPLSILSVCVHLSIVHIDSPLPEFYGEPFHLGLIDSFVFLWF